MESHESPRATIAAARIVFDIAERSPKLFAALRVASPELPRALERLRAGVPVLPTAAPGVYGDFYRLRRHNRSICLSLKEDKAASDVVAFKGTEPLLPDFEAFLAWLGRQPHRETPSLLEHFPLYEGKAPGCCYVHEGLAEAMIAMELQEHHLEHYGELARLPTPLLVWALPDAVNATTTERIRNVVSQQAFDRVEPHLKGGLGVYAYHYPSPPVRASAVALPFLDGVPSPYSPLHSALVAVPRWAQLFARLVWLGYLPMTAATLRLGSMLDLNNACLDGGACDIGTVLRIANAPSDAFFAESFVIALGGLRQAIAHAVGIPMGELSSSMREAVIGSYIEEGLRREINRAFASEARPSLTLDPRVAMLTGDKTVAEWLKVLSTLIPPRKATEYEAPRSAG